MGSRGPLALTAVHAAEDPMSEIDYEAGAYAHYDDGRGEADEFGPVTLARAVRLIMEQIPEAMQPHAWVTVGERRLGLKEIREIYYQPGFPRQ